MSSTTTWASPLSGLLDRAQPYPLYPGGTFKPLRSSLELVSVRSARGQGVTLNIAIFSASLNEGEQRTYYAVNSNGKILSLPIDEATALLSLASSTLTTYPNTGGSWTLDRKHSSPPSDRLLVPRATLNNDSPNQDYSAEFLVARVDGFDYKTRQLRGEVEGLQQLPEGLWEVLGVVLEGRKSSESEKDEGVLKYVEDLVWNVYHPGEAKE